MAVKNVTSTFCCLVARASQCLCFYMLPDFLCFPVFMLLLLPCRRGRGMAAARQARRARLVLQDGSVFPGEAFGATQATAGEVGEYGDTGAGCGYWGGGRC